MRKILCLDFDGVICDSIDETLLTTYNSYQIYHGKNYHIIYNLDEIPADIKVHFIKYRYLVRPAGEFWLLMKIFFENITNINQQSFNKIVKQHKNEIDKFSSIFFSIRNKLQEKNLQVWLDLHHLFPQFIEAWSDLRNQFNIYIVTTKNLSAIVTLLEYFKISILPENIWTKEKMKSKTEAVKAIARSQKIPYSKIIFIDDHPLHLHEVEKTGTQCYLANWGYYREDIGGLSKIAHLGEVIINES